MCIAGVPPGTGLGNTALYNKTIVYWSCGAIGSVIFDNKIFSHIQLQLLQNTSTKHLFYLTVLQGTPLHVFRVQRVNGLKRAAQHVRHVLLSILSSQKSPHRCHGFCRMPNRIMNCCILPTIITHNGKVSWWRHRFPNFDQFDFV